MLPACFAGCRKVLCPWTPLIFLVAEWSLHQSRDAAQEAWTDERNLMLSACHHSLSSCPMLLKDATVEQGGCYLTLSSSRVPCSQQHSLSRNSPTPRSQYHRSSSYWWFSSHPLKYEGKPCWPSWNFSQEASQERGKMASVFCDPLVCATRTCWFDWLA